MTTASRKKPAPRRADPDATLARYQDQFQLTEAPYRWEERVSASGRSYSVKVYEREAYTAAHMAKSAESGRLVRWAAVLSDGRLVSRDGLIRMRDPEGWEREVKPRVAKLRGDAREAALADAFWSSLSPAEREALAASVDLDAYADGRGERAALRDLLADLRAGGSPLAFVDVGWWARIRDRYARRHLGGPVGSAAWASAPWSHWVAYDHERQGLPQPAESDPRTIEGVSAGTTREEPYVPSAWWYSLIEYLANAAGPRVAEADFVAATLAARLGGAPDPVEVGEFPPQRAAEARASANRLRAERLRRMDRGLAASALARGANEYSALSPLAGREFLASFGRWLKHAPSARGVEPASGR